MKIKRLIATALAAAMIFGLVSVGLAAGSTLPDVEGHEFEEEIRTLAGLKVIEGYPDGEFKADNKLTRAEFTALIIRLLGLEGMAEGMAGETVPFADVAGTHWASGHILIAEALGIVNGYPDGTFKPENDVSHAESVKMILTAMGYKEEGFPVVRWPVTWLVQADQIGLDEDVVLLGNLPITRGDVAKLLHNSLGLPHHKVSEGKHVVDEYKDKDKQDTPVTFLYKLGVQDKNGLIIDSPELWSNEKGKTEIKWDEADAEPSEFEITGYEGLLGHKVKVWYEKDVVYHIEDLSTEKEFSWKDYKKEFIDKKVEDEVAWYVNYQVAEAEKEDEEFGWSNIDDKYEDIVVVYHDKKPIAVKALNYTVGTVKETYVYGSSRKDIYFQDSSPKLALAKAEVEYFGVDGFEEIEEDDVVHFIKCEDKDGVVTKAIVIVLRDIYEGRVTEVISGKEWKVDGKVFNIEDAEIASAVEKDPLGAKVTLYLNKDGKVIRITGDVVSDSETIFGVIQETRDTWSAKEGDRHFATIITKDGEFEYEVDYQDQGGNDKEVIGVGTPVEAVSLTDDDKYEVSIARAVYARFDDKGQIDKDYYSVVTDVYKEAGKLYLKVVKEVGKDSEKENLKGTSESIEYTSDTLWLEGKPGAYETRPVPHVDDKVVLFLIDNGKIVIGVVIGTIK